MIPVDFSGHRSSSISAIAYHRLRDYLGLEKKPMRVYDPIQQLAIVDEDVLQRFNVDAVELGRGFALDDKDWTEWVLPDGSPCLIPIWSLPERETYRWVIRSKTGRVIAQMPDGALYFEQTHYPYYDIPSDFDHIEEAMDQAVWTAIATPPGPLVEGPGGDERFVAGAQQLRASTDRAIIGLFGGNLLETGQFLFRNDQFFMLLASEPDQAHAFLEKLTAIHLRKLEKYLRLVGPYIDIILVWR